MKIKSRFGTFDVLGKRQVERLAVLLKQQNPVRVTTEAVIDPSSGSRSRWDGESEEFCLQILSAKTGD